jgi:hypothetical protein
VSSPYSKLGIGEIATKNLNEFELPEMDKIESEETQIERQWPATSFQPNHHVNAVIAEHEMSLNLPAVKTAYQEAVKSGFDWKILVAPIFQYRK